MSRLFHKSAPPVAPPRATAPVRSIAARPAATAAQAAPPGAAALGVGARRPLVSAQGALAGFEFTAGEFMLKRLHHRQDGAAAGAYSANLLGAMRLCATQGMVALAELPASWLLRIDAQLHGHAGMHLLLRADGWGDDAAAAAALVPRWRAAGARVGWDPLAAAAVPAAAGRPDFMPMCAPPGSGAGAWRAAVDDAAGRWPGVPLALLELPAVDVLEAVLAPPVLLAACSLGACTVPPRARALAPQTQRLLQLLNRLLHDDDNAALVADIKADAALGLRLLQHLNSAGATPGRELDSIEQAVLVLGRDKLYRWVAQLLVRMSPPRPAAGALQAMALARARLFEALARAAGAAHPGSLYLLGLASMLPLLLSCSIDDAAQAMRLPHAATQALRQQGGPWQAYLSVLSALEANDLPAVEALAAPFGGFQAVLACWTEAWAER